MSAPILSPAALKAHPITRALVRGAGFVAGMGVGHVLIAAVVVGWHPRFLPASPVPSIVCGLVAIGAAILLHWFALHLFRAMHPNGARCRDCVPEPPLPPVRTLDRYRT